MRTDKPDYSKLLDYSYTWMQSVYSKVLELVADDIPIPHGNLVITTTYKDANLFHDFVTKRAVRGIFYLLNQTLIDWFSKKTSYS